MNRAERRAKARKTQGFGDPGLRAAVVELQRYAAGPAQADFVNEIVLRLQGADTEFINTELARISGMLLEAVLGGNPTISRTLARGLVYASMDLVRTHLTVVGRGGTT